MTMIWISAALIATSFALLVCAKVLMNSGSHKRHQMVLPLNVIAFAIGLAGIFAFYLFLDGGGRF